ncbi:MAG: hypothetical protein ACREQ9_26370 [Candidatus Binatia bacterium]
MHTRASRPVRLATLLLLLLPWLAVAEHPPSLRSAYFRALRIDAADLRLELRDFARFPWEPHDPSVVSFYFLFTDGRGRPSVTHYRLKPDGRREPLNYLEADVDFRLTYRTKYHELTAGPYGAVYAKSTYYYSPTYGDQPAELHTAAYLNDLGERPARGPEPPSEKLPLDGVSLVRVFRGGPEFLVVSANYSPEGSLQAIHVNGGRGGEWVHSNEVELPPGIGTGTMIGDRPATREYFALPETFPIERYQDGGNVSGRTELPLHEELVYFHYDRNFHAREDRWSGEALLGRTWLAYEVTPEDRALAPVDRKRPFGARR